MRKIAIMLLVATTLVTLNSCQKTKSESTSPSKVSSLQKIDYLIPLSDSGVHNDLTRYVAQHHTQPASNLTECAAWYVDAYNALYGTELNVDSMAGVLVANSRFDSIAEATYGNMAIPTVIANWMPSTKLKAALLQINSSTDTGEVFINNAKSIIAALTGLNSYELRVADGLTGILEGSNNLSDEMQPMGAPKTDKEIKDANRRIAEADAYGFAEGYYLSGGSLLYARLDAAWTSEAQRYIENGGKWHK